MKYLCLVYGSAAGAAESGDRDHQAYAELLAGRGSLLAGELLAAEYASTRVRLQQGRVAISDGPETELAAPLAGFFLLQARDLNEAILLASGIPLARVGWVDIRPVRVGG